MRRSPRTIAATVLAGTFSWANVAFAQQTPQPVFGQPGGSSGMGDRIWRGMFDLANWSGFVPPAPGRPRSFVEILGSYTNGLLTLLGLLFLIMIIRGGVIWMTAGGDENKAGQAKLIIKNSVFGLGVVLLSRIFVNLFLAFLAPAVTSP